MYRKKSTAFLVAALFVWAARGRRAEAGATKPNLKLTSITLSDATPSVGQPISITVNVRNASSVAAGAFDVDLFYDRGSAPVVGESGDESQTVASLGGNKLTNVVFTGITSLVEATWSTYAIVDTDNLVDEIVETDNVSLAESIPWGAPDLLVVDITPSNSSPVVNDTISVTVGVTNEGVGDAASFTVELFYNRASPPSLGEIGDQTQTVLSLGATKSANVTFAGITNGTVETWSMYAIVNTDGAVIESDDTNNGGGPAQVVWSAAGFLPDLTVTLIEPSSLTPPVGGTIGVNVTVENAGDADVGSFRLDLFYDSTPAPGMGDTGDQNQTVAGLAATTSTVVTFTGVTSPVPADWSMYAIVDTLESVGESDETNNVAGPEAVQWRGTDLVVTNITPSGIVPLMGETITVDVTVENVGNVDIAVSFDVELFYDPAPAPPSVGTSGDKTLSVPSLAAGTATTLTFTNVTSTSAGDWNTYAIVDNGTAISEYDETNNVTGPVSVTWRAPDLIVVSITPSNSSPTAGDTISVDVVIENQGDANAGGFDVGLFYNLGADPTPGDSADQTERVNNLGAGNQAVVTFTGVTNAAAATWEMYVVADNVASPGEVSEGEELNNVSGPVNVVWGAVGTSPDLFIVSVVPTKTDPVIGEVISVSVTVENQGDADAGAFVVALFNDEPAVPSVGDPADQTQGVAALAQGTQDVVIFTGITSATTGAWSMYAIADNGSAVAESDETNNVSTAAAVSWHAPELVITDISPSDSDPNVGDVISVDVTVKNNGDVPASAFDVGLFYDEATAPSVGDAADQTQNVASLAVGAETTLTFVGVASPSSGAWDVYAAVDNGSAVAESDETNNVTGPTVVTWHGPDLVISAISPSDATPATIDTISVDVTVTNLGDRDAGSFDVGLFYNSATSPSVGDAADQTENVALLAAGNQTVVTFSGITNAVEEVWKTWATADNGSAIIEGDETNNVGGPATITWGAPDVPDLVVVSVVPSNATPNTGDTISVDVTISNNGTLDASLFDVGLYYNLAAAPSVGDAADQTKGVGTLAAGTQKVLTFTGVTNAAAEVWQMYALVDSDGVVTESNEANNTAGPIEVNWGAVAGITVIVPNGGETWESGTTQQIEWQSYGDIGTTNVTIEYSVDGGGNWVNIVGSTPDDGVYDWEVPLADSTECLVLVSSEGGSHFDESDGFFTIIPPGVGKPNLRIVSVSPSSSMPNAGGTISVDVTVRNTGNAPSGLCYVDLFYSRSTEPAVGEMGDQSDPVNFLDVGDEVNVIFSGVSSALPGIWQMYAVVDTQGYVEESNEGDNVAGPVEIGWSTMVDSLRVTAPNGFDTLEQDKTFTVTWTWTGSPGLLVNVEVSTNGGATWQEVVNGTINDGTYEWTVSVPASSDCRLRISNFSGTVADVSDDRFTIRPAGASASFYFGGGCGSGAGAVMGLMLCFALGRRRT